VQSLQHPYINAALLEVRVKGPQRAADGPGWRIHPSLWILRGGLLASFGQAAPHSLRSRSPLSGVVILTEGDCGARNGFSGGRLSAQMRHLRQTAYPTCPTFTAAIRPTPGWASF